MIIGIDIDDTISDTTGIMFDCCQKYVAEELGREPLVQDEAKFTHHYIEVVHGLSKEEIKEFFRRHYEYMVDEVHPKPYVVEYLNKLREDGNKIVLVTARFEIKEFDVIESTKKWLDKYQIPYDKIIFNAESKLEIAKNEKIDVFIDDSYKNCQDMAGTGIKAFLMDARGNRGLETNGFERVYSWPHLYYKLKNEGEV